MSDRRRYARLDLDRGQHLESLRFRFEMRWSRVTSEVVATRGQRLALTRSRFDLVDRDAGPSETESLVVSENDQHGVDVALVVFDPDDLDAAYAELDERFAAGEGASSGTQLRMVAQDFAARDWDALATRLTPDIVVYDHRPLGWDTLRGPQAYIEMLKVLVDLAPDVRHRPDHVRVGERKDLIVTTLRGTREGGAFEDQRVIVAEGDDLGRVRRIDFYTLEQLDAALARYDALAGAVEGRPMTPSASPLGEGRTEAGSPSTPRIENAATRAADLITEAWNARDWERLAALFPAGFRNIDRRKMMQVELDRQQFLEGCRSFLEMASSVGTQEVLATRGNRLVLRRSGWRGADREVGPSEVDLVEVLEVNAAGEHIASVYFDLDDLDAAYAELDERYAAGEAAHCARAAETLRRYARAGAARDWEAMASVFDPNLVFEDHRLIGWGTLHSRDEYVATIRALVDLAPDVTVRVDHVLALDDRGAFVIGRWVGSREGGAFEIPFVGVSVLGADGHMQRIDTHDLEQFEEARARFAELVLSRARPEPGRGVEGLRPDPLRIPPNAATRAVERFWECIEKQDWEALRALCAPILWEDRRRLIRTSGDCDMVIANSKLIARARPRASRTVVATSGDRLLLQRISLTGSVEGQSFEVDLLEVFEVDAEGRIVALIGFDPDDRRAASAEMLEHYARSDAARCIPAAVFEALRAVNAHDLERLRAGLPDDFVLDDHRRTGLGRLESAEEYVASAAALFEPAPDVTAETLYVVAVEPHGILVVARNFGTLREGGEFESVYVRIMLYQGDRLVGVEMFEIEDLDRARARFEELRPDPLRIPPNAATRSRAKWSEGFQARDWAAVRSVVSDDFIYEDRGKRALVSGNVETWLASMQFVSSLPGFQFENELIATLGERIALEGTVWSGGPERDAFETRHIRLLEVDAEGRLRASILFDPDDRRAAFAEAQARFVAGEAAAIGGQAPIAGFNRAVARRDWESGRGCFVEHLVLRDHRTLGFGTLGRDEWIESLRVMQDLAPDWNAETLRILAWNRHGRVDLTRQFGTLRDGGPFETVFARVIVTAGDRIQHYEVFNVGDAERAVVRFAELCAARQTGC